MSVVFGDFVFKISAPVQNAIDNLKRWDNASEGVAKNQKEIANKEQDSLKERTQAQTNFYNAVQVGFLALAAIVMKWSPHINAHLSIIGIHMKLLAMDIGKTWAPAFKFASKVFGDFVKTWRDWGKGSKKLGLEEAEEELDGLFGALGITKGGLADIKKVIHDVGNTALGLAAGLSAIGFSVGILNLALPILNPVLGATITLLKASVLSPPILIVLLLIAGAALLATSAIEGYNSAAAENYKGINDDVKEFDKQMEKVAEIRTEQAKRADEAWGSLFKGDIFDAAIKGFESLGIGAGGTTEEMKGAFSGAQAVYKSVEKYYTDFRGWTTDTTKLTKTVENETRLSIDQMQLDNLDALKKQGIWSGEFQKVHDDLTAKVEATFAESTENAKGYGADMVKNYMWGINSQSDYVNRGIFDFRKKNIENSLSFDIKANDRMAQKWGSDMVNNFAQGARQSSGNIINQKVFQNLTINNSASREGMDVYGLANLIENTLNESIRETKGLSSQYY